MEILFRISSIICRIFFWLVKPFIIYRIGIYSKMEIPANTDKLLNLSATKLAKLIRTKKLSSMDIITAYIFRIKTVNPIINAMIQDRFEEAISEAKYVDDFLLKTNLTTAQLELDFPLLGVPITVKENLSVKGLSFTVGSLTRLGYVAEEDGEAVQCVKNSGAIVLLVSNNPEYCLSIETSNFITGTTLNPYDTRRTAGGSSGGEATLLSTASSIIGIGSDSAGSIRLPAAFNCIFGHKPSRGVTPIDGQFPIGKDKNFFKYIVVGPMTRYAEDLELLMKVLSKKSGCLNLDREIDFSKVTVYYMEDCGDSFGTPPVSKDIKYAIRESANYLKRNRGTYVSPKKFAEFGISSELTTSLGFEVKVSRAIEDAKGHPNIFMEVLKSFFKLSNFPDSTVAFEFFKLTNGLIPVERNEYFHEFADKFAEKLQKILGSNGILLYPTFPSSAFKHGNFFSNIFGLMYTMIFNILGLPATTVPAGLDRNGLPIALQVIAGPNNDVLCFAVAKELEICFGGWLPPFDNVPYTTSN